MFMMGDGSDTPKEIDESLAVVADYYLKAHQALKAWEQKYAMHAVKYTILGLFNIKQSFEREENGNYHE